MEFLNWLHWVVTDVLVKILAAVGLVAIIWWLVFH